MSKHEALHRVEHTPTTMLSRAAACLTACKRVVPTTLLVDADLVDGFQFTRETDTTMTTS